MHRKRLAVALAATLALSTVAAACGDDDNGEQRRQKTTTTAAKGETTTTATPATPAADNGGRKDGQRPAEDRGDPAADRQAAVHRSADDPGRRHGDP